MEPTVLPSCRGLRVMIIDDDELICDALSLFCSSHKMESVTHQTAESALRQLKRHHFDIMFTDYSLSGMDGIAFLRAASRLAPQAKKVLMTAQPDKHLMKLAYQNGADGYLQKPLTASSLQDCLQVLMQI